MITIYGSAQCPRCTVIEAKIKNAGLEYEKITDEATVVAKGEEIGCKTLPIIFIDGEHYQFKEASAKLNEIINNNRKEIL